MYLDSNLQYCPVVAIPSTNHYLSFFIFSRSGNWANWNWRRRYWNNGPTAVDL